MRTILLTALLSLSLSAVNIKLANSNSEFNSIFVTSSKKLKSSGINLAVFNESKIYKNNGALLGVLNNKIDLAVVSKSFLDEITEGKLSEKALERINLTYFIENGEYAIVSNKKLRKRVSKKDFDTIVKVINNQLKENQDD